MRLEAAAARGPAGAAEARRCFFRAAAAAPAHKALWLAGLAACNACPGALSDGERAGLMAAARRGGLLRLRTDLAEVLYELQLRALG